MQHVLRDGVAACHFAQCAIILDIAQDRYWMVAGRTAAALASIVGDGKDAVPLDDIARLAALGLIVPATGTAAPRASCLPATCTVGFEGNPSSRIGLAGAMQVAGDSAAAWFGLRTRPLARLIADVERRRRMPRPPRLPIENLAVAFWRYRAWVPLPQVCLPDSLALLALAARNGHYPQLVFGVIASPFAAHCWVQHGDMILNDTLDHVAQFTPILTI